MHNNNIDEVNTYYHWKKQRNIPQKNKKIKEIINFHRGDNVYQQHDKREKKEIEIK